MPCLKTMTAEWLQQRGYHGLVNADGECGCSCANPKDFMPCNEPGTSCAAAIEIRTHGEGIKRFIKPQWFSSEKCSPSQKGNTPIVQRYADGAERRCTARNFGDGSPMMDGSHVLVAWRYDLPRGSWTDGDDQSKLPKGEL